MKTTVRAALASTAALVLVGALVAPSQAAVPTSKRFDLSASLTKNPLLKQKSLKHPTVMQSFAWDPTNNDLFTVQGKSGEKNLGNLVVTSRPGHSNSSYMVLNGFGHGATMGIERATSKSQLYLWVESKANKKKSDDAFGTRIARVAWKKKGRVSPSSSRVQDLTPPAAAGKSPRPVVDQKNNLLIVRTTTGKNKYRFRAWKLADAVAKKWTAVQYDRTISVRQATSQGYTVYGGYIYLYWGNANKKNTILETYSIKTGKRVQAKNTEAYKSLSYREPEGVGIYRPRSSKPVLGFGFASGKAGARKATIAGKAKLVG